MLKYGTKTFSPHHIHFILVEAWDAFKIPAGKIMRDSFEKKKLPPLRPPNLTTNTQACAASIQVYSGAKAEEINNISLHKVAPIDLQVNITDDPMVVFQAKSTQQSSRKIIIQAVLYNAVRKITVIPIQDMNK